ncbi:MetQ/NlpA family ABC transporter substrate-binding protein [Leadbettera azotonutricia]|uniref:D-methionine ABC transporter, periplasmic D-methionine-binding protein n=1 Tax=Leadbettera azotonutricia (strain ATCC BAA-888 / DSM 13862 / ZAS-9) TaxID=545695 RepID=F5YAH6_LEAAZ|nr:MetQ/NlpA family ABC transporter substrate-binding protein [Leadbettera azotonutricia]AEF83291.1 D-methionine ABC transporter, periplasmic D-methionine-binding protein [Leadbettera azotonutricia ZAS-9]
MKKLVLFSLIALLAVSGAFAKGGGDKSGTLTVGATPVPHAELLNLVKADLASQGITLVVREFNDYVQPNEALIAGDLDANFFQHIPYLESNDNWKAKLSSAFGVHVEPLGLYSQKYKTVNDLPNGASIAIPNDPTNGGRALLLLQAKGLITLKANAGLTATPQDVSGNPKNYRFTELEAAQLPRALGDVDAAIINGNYALEAGLNPVRDSLIIEGADSPYVNIVTVQKGKEKDARIVALEKALKSQKVKDYIQATYDGGVVAVF